MNIFAPTRLLVTGSALNHSVGRDSNESQNWMCTYLTTIQPSLSAISAPTKIQILEICVSIRENIVIKRVFSVKYAEKHSNG